MAILSTNLKTTLLTIICLAAQLISFLASAEPQSNFKLTLANSKDNTTISADSFRKISEQFRLVTDKLPSTMKDRINIEVPVLFAKIDEKNKLNVFDICKPGSHRLAFTRPFASRPTIVINNEFLDIFNSNQTSISIPCTHGDIYKTFQSLIIHELSHIYESRLALTSDEQSELQNCQIFQADQNQQNLRCKYLQQLTTFISGRISFQKMAKVKKNFLGARSPDPYELKNPEENFAVNMEYFILDSQYQCRRPAYYHFLSSHFNFVPFESETCPKSNFLVSSLDGRKITLDHKRIYQIHYLFAGPGEALMSSWGHAMIRLIVCDPRRTEVSAECLKDVSSHLVVSFRANIADMITNYWKGVVGKYPSQVFILPMWKVINEYTREESRDLTSYPLVLSEEQKKAFLNHVLEVFWSYSGKYYFISNNCATETFDLISGILPDYHGLNFEIPPMSPKGLLFTLNKVHLLSPLPTDQATRISLGYYFPTTVKKEIDEAFKQIVDVMKGEIGYSTSDEYIQKTNPDQRRQLFDLALSKQNSTSVAASFFTLEVKIDRDFTKDIQKDIGKALEKQITGDSSLAKYRQLIEELSPWKHVNGGYGVPEESEFNHVDMLQDFDTFNREFGDLSKIIDLFDKKKAADKRSIQLNIEYFFASQFKLILTSQPSGVSK